jgi:hypothetical protein
MHGSFVLFLHKQPQRHGLWFHHFHNLHHAEIFVVKDVAAERALISRPGPVFLSSKTERRLTI